MHRGVSFQKHLDRLQQRTWNLTLHRQQNTIASAERDSIAIPGHRITQNGTINFDDAEKACQSKTTWDLLRSSLILNACSVETFAKHNYQILSWTRRLMGRSVFNAMMRPTVYKQFVGGDDFTSFQETVSRLQTAGVRPLVMVTLEEDVKDDGPDADELFDRNLKIMIDCMEMTASLGSQNPMMQIKPSGLFPLALCKSISTEVPFPSSQPEIVEKIANSIETSKEVTELGKLSTTEIGELNKALNRINQICEVAMKRKLMIMIDAEYTYLNPCLNLLTLAMMLHSNRSEPLVAYTYQNYLKETPNVLLKDIELARTHGVTFGAKLVRGAYIYKERALAKEKGYPDPVCETFEKTTENYNRSMDIMMEKVVEHPGKFCVTIASHNEDTVKRGTNKMAELGISGRSLDHKVFFAQLYGMSDFISMSLGQAGYMTYKSIPYGTIDEALPYLSRRLNENSSILGGVRREREIIRAALGRRLFSPTNLMKR